MMNVACPNKNWPPYKAVVAKHGEDYAFQAWILSGYNGFDSLEDAENLVNTQAQLDNSTIVNIKKELTRVLTIQKKIYEKRPGGKKYLLEINEVLEQLNSNNNLAALVKMLEFSKASSAQVLSRLSEIKSKYNTDFSKLSQDELIKLAETMQEIKRFVSTYNILEDMEQLSIFADTDSEDSKSLRSTLSNFRRIVKNYKEIHEEILATWLATQAERVNEGIRAQGRMELILTKARIKTLINTAISDISVWEKMFGAQANSKDPLTGLVASAVKEEAYKKHLENVAIQERLISLYKASGGSNDPAKFNAKYLRDVDNYEFVPELDAKGNPIHNEQGIIKGSKRYVKRKAFITKYKEDQFWKDFRTFNESVSQDDLGENAVFERIMARNRWMAANSVRIDNPADIIEAQRKILNPLEFDRWFSENTERITIKYYSNGTNLNYFAPEKIHEVSKDGKTFVIYKDISDFYRPSDKYLNPAFTNLQGDAYYQELLKTYTEANNKVDESKRLKYGIIPQRRATGFDKYINSNSTSLLQNLKDDFGHSVNIETYDTSYGLQTPDKKDLKYIPIYFTHMLPEHEVSKDLLESTLAYSQMANNYNAMSKIEPFIEMVYDAVEGNAVVEIDARDVQIMNARGVVKTEPMTGTPLTSRTKKVNEALLEFLDKVVYGSYEIPEVFTIGDKEFSKNKLAKKVIAFSSLNGLAFNINSFFNNTLLGNFTMAIESFSGQYFNKKDLINAEGVYFKHIASIFGDIAAGYPKSKLGKLLVKYDVMQGEFQNSYGENVSGNAAKRLLTTNSLFFLTHGAEHQIQSTGFIAMAKNQKVTYQDGSTSSLWDAYDEKGNLKKGAIWSEKDQFAFMQKMHSLNKGMHGIYNQFDSPTLKRRWYGKLALLFRNWIYSGIQRRYSGEFINIESGVIEEGYYRKFFTSLYKELSVGKTDMLFGNNLTPDQKAARAKSLAEVSAMVLIFATYAALSGDDDDKPNTWLQNQLILQTRRLGGDLMFYTPINIYEPLRILRNPSAAITNIEKTQKFMFQLVNPFEQYEQKSGYYEKGDYKIEKRFNDLVPIYNQLIRFSTPEQQLKEYMWK
tara:strand:- start:16606 stop:19851 length:3246 start_codon:yes stop_codon:yes gene_type:complete